MTIIPRGNRFGAKVWDKGKGSYRWVGTFDTEDEAIRAEKDASFRPGRDAPTVSEWGRVWLSDYARAAPATQRTYRYAIKRIDETIGSRRLGEIGRREARQLANEWPVSVARVARTMWADAVRDEVCELNPWTNLRLETPRGRKDLTALTEEQIQELAQMAQQQHLDWGFEARAIVLTLGYTGVRPGELFALLRTDLDLPNRELTVSKNLDASGIVKPPKNGKARVITVPPIAADAIRQMPGYLWPSGERLFHSISGKRLNKTNFAFAWRPIAAAWQAEHGKRIQPYELRHACATLLLERDLTPADVAHQLGHSDGGRLVQVLYGHPAENATRDRLKMAFDAPSPELHRPAVARRSASNE